MLALSKQLTISFDAKLFVLLRVSGNIFILKGSLLDSLNPLPLIRLESGRVLLRTDLHSLATYYFPAAGVYGCIVTSFLS